MNKPLKGEEVPLGWGRVLSVSFCAHRPPHSLMYETRYLWHFEIVFTLYRPTLMDQLIPAAFPLPVREVLEKSINARACEETLAQER
jgi:hypothetical protein